MPKLGRRSLKRLKGVDPRHVSVLQKVVKYYDITVVEGLRSQERQDEMVKSGQYKNKIGCVLGVAAMMGVNIRWGGDWSSPSLDKNVMMGKEVRTTADNGFDDLLHFELVEE